jgi:hypothetical protein
MSRETTKKTALSDLHLTCHWIDDLMDEEDFARLSNICTPYDVAKPGDIVALLYTARITFDEVQIDRAKTVVVINDAGRPVHRRYTDLPVETTHPRSDDIMRLESFFAFHDVIDQNPYGLNCTLHDSSDVEALTITLTAAGACFEYVDYTSNKLEKGGHPVALTQEVINSCFFMVANRPASVHDIVARMKALSATASLFVHINKIINPDTKDLMSIALPTFEMSNATGTDETPTPAAYYPMMSQVAASVL